MTAENYTLSDSDLYQVLSLSLWLGSCAPKYDGLVLIDVIQKFAEYSLAMNFSITPENIVDEFGARLSDAQGLITVVFPSAEELGWATNYIIDVIKPHLPHPKNPTVVTPLFIAFTIVTAFIMGLRLWSRFKIAGGIRSFDWLAVAGFFLTAAWGGLAVYHVDVSTENQAFYDITYASVIKIRAAYFSLTVIYPWVMMVIKFSLLLFYYRMTKWNYIQWSCWATAFIVVGNTVSSLVLYLIQNPHVDWWNYMFEDSRFQRRTVNAAIAGIYIATDVIIWIMPMPLVFQLKLYPRERILALITFSLGAVACVASCIRLDAILKFDTYSAQSSSSLLVDAWTILELYLTLICASAPALRALAIHYAPKMLNSVGSAAFSTAATTSTTVAKKTNGNVSSNTSVNTDQKGDVKTKVTSELDDLEKEVEKEYARAEREAEREAQKEAERAAQEQAEKDAQNEAAPQAVEKQA